MNILFEPHKEFSESILTRKFYETVNADDIINSWKDLFDKGLITGKTKGVINDINACELSMNMEGFGKLIAFLKSHEVFKKIKLAVICDDPGKIVFPMIGEAKAPQLKIKPFATEEAALEWIMD